MYTSERKVIYEEGKINASGKQTFTLHANKPNDLSEDEITFLKYCKHQPYTKKTILSYEFNLPQYLIEDIAKLKDDDNFHFVLNPKEEKRFSVYVPK